MLDVNTVPFYVKDLSICGFRCPWGVLEPTRLLVLKDDCTREQGRHGAPRQLKMSKSKTQVERWCQEESHLQC